MDDPIAAVERFRAALSAGTSDRRLDRGTGADAFVEVIAPYLDREAARRSVEGQS